jgi:hypothetical protein
VYGTIVQVVHASMETGKGAFMPFTKGAGHLRPTVRPDYWKVLSPKAPSNWTFGRSASLARLPANSLIKIDPDQD